MVTPPDVTATPATNTPELPAAVALPLCARVPASAVRDDACRWAEAGRYQRRRGHLTAVRLRLSAATAADARPAVGGGR